MGFGGMGASHRMVRCTRGIDVGWWERGNEVPGQCLAGLRALGLRTILEPIGCCLHCYQSYLGFTWVSTNIVMCLKETLREKLLVCARKIIWRSRLKSLSRKGLRVLYGPSGAPIMTHHQFAFAPQKSILKACFGDAPSGC